MQSIKKAQLKDLNTLLDIENRVFNNDPFALSKSSFRYHLNKNEMFIIEVEDKIAGYILWLKRKEYYRLYSIAVDNSFQGLGLSSKLLEYSFEKLNNKKRFTLEVKTKNEKAIKLYEKYDFKVKKVLKDYYEENSGFCDGFLMEKFI